MIYWDEGEIMILVIVNNLLNKIDFYFEDSIFNGIKRKNVVVGVYFYLKWEIRIIK